MKRVKNQKNKPEEFSKGGKVKTPQKALGGFINGPQSGYPVSLDGGDPPRLSDTDVSMLLEKVMGEAFRRSS